MGTLFPRQKYASIKSFAWHGKNYTCSTEIWNCSYLSLVCHKVEISPPGKSEEMYEAKICLQDAHLYIARLFWKKATYGLRGDGGIHYILCEMSWKNDTAPVTEHCSGISEADERNWQTEVTHYTPFRPPLTRFGFNNRNSTPPKQKSVNLFIWGGRE